MSTSIIYRGVGGGKLCKMKNWKNWKIGKNFDQNSKWRQNYCSPLLSSSRKYMHVVTYDEFEK